METERQRRGRIAEDTVLAAAKANGFTLVARNYHHRFGELDLILSQHDMLVVVEVRYRSRTDFGGAVETVTRSKQKRIIATTQAFIAAHRHWRDAAIRFDVVGVNAHGQLQWIEHAFLGE